MNKTPALIAVALACLGAGGYFGWQQYQSLMAEKEAARIEAEKQADFALSMAVAAGLHAQAAERLLPRVEAGEAKAQYQLGTLLMRGGGTLPARPAEARQLFERAIEQGFGPAATNLGYMMMEGRGGTVDFKRAVALFEVEAAEGDAVAQNNIGALYATGGHGLIANPAKARDWYQKAAEAGHPPAQNSLCSLLADEGRAEPKQYRQAVSWCRKSAEAGFPPAQANLGVLLSRAPGFQRDIIEAWVWSSMAAYHGSTAGTNLAARLADQLDEEQMAEAKRRFDRLEKALWQAPEVATLQQ